jgi:hypothetical protein
LYGEINPLFPEVVDHLLWDDLQKGEYSIITKFSKIFYKMLVDYKKFSGKGAKEPCSLLFETSNRLQQMPGEIYRSAELLVIITNGKFKSN